MTHDLAIRLRFRPAALAVGAVIVVLPIQSLPSVGTLPVPPVNLVLLSILGTLLIATVITGRLRYNIKLPLQFHLWLFTIYAAISIVYGKIGLDNRKLSVLHLVSGDQLYLPVALQRLLQIIFCITALELIRRSRLSTETLMRAWLSSTLFFSLIHLIIVIIVGTADGRPGTFTEGNFAGLFYVFSLFIALEYRRLRPPHSGWLFVTAALLGLILARSSTSFVAVGFALVARQLLLPSTSIQQRLRQVGRLLMLALIPAGLVLSGNDFGLSAKLLTQEVTPDSFSRIDRLLSLVTAGQIFLDTPVFGSGLQSYGFIANTYLADGPFEAVYNFGFRRIPNNIYAEIGAELGIVGILVFFGIILRIMYKVIRGSLDDGRNMIAGMLAVLVYWFAFPTYSVIFVWVFFGLVLRYSRDKVRFAGQHTIGDRIKYGDG